MDEKELLTDEEIKAIESCLTLPEDMAEATDFIAEEAIQIDKSIKLPDFYSLGERIYETSNQGALGSCTSMGTTHATQILAVKKNGVKPTDKNIITPNRKDLWAKMGHSITKYDGGDYVEKAVGTALKEGIVALEDGKLIKFDGYAYGEWSPTNNYNDAIDMMKRYLYNGNPIVWCVRGDKTTWNEMSAGEVKTYPQSPTGGHCIALVGWDANGFWFINSWSPNDANKRKSRFYVSFDVMRKYSGRFNWRYWILYTKQEAKIDTERLKKIKVYITLLEVLKKYYNNETTSVQNGIVTFSQAVRKEYPEINKDLPIK